MQVFSLPRHSSRIAAFSRLRRDPHFWTSPNGFFAVWWTQFSPEWYPPQSCWHWGIIKINHELGIVLQISAKGKTLPILRGWIPHNHSVITILCPRYRWNIPTYIRVINTFTNHLQMDIFHHSYRGTITELIRARVYHGFTHINIHHIIVWYPLINTVNQLLTTHYHSYNQLSIYNYIYICGSMCIYIYR